MSPARPTRKSACPCCPTGDCDAAFWRFAAARCTSPPKARWASPRGATACATACASPPRITRSSRSICGRASPIPLSASYRGAALVPRRGRALHGEHRLGAPRLAARGFKNLAAWRRGVDTELFKPQPKDFLDLPRPIAAYVGRVAVEKNVDAFLKMPWAGSKIVIGDGPERARCEANIRTRVFMGYRFGEDLARHLAAADVMVFPSRTDTFGLVNLEAMACGVPVAAYPVTGPIDVIEDGVTGALDTDLAAAAARALKVDPKACRERAVKSGWDVCSREFEGNLERCDALLQPKLILASRLVRESALDSASSSSIRPSRTRL